MQKKSVSYKSITFCPATAFKLQPEKNKKQTNK